MPTLIGVLVGALGGLAGVALGHLAVRLAYLWTGDANLWFKGPHGPPFFDLLLSTSIFYAGVGAGLYPKSRRARGMGLGFFAAFVGLFLPLTFATRIFTWGEGPTAQPTYAWIYLIICTYAVTSIATVLLLGGLCMGTFRWRSGIGALAGSLAGYLAGLGLLRILPQLRVDPFAAPGLWPPAGALLDGALSGACITAGVLWAGNRSRLRRTAA